MALAHNDGLMQRPELLNRDAFGVDWMLIVRPSPDNWSADLTTGAAIGPASTTWIASEAYKERTN